MAAPPTIDVSTIQKKAFIDGKFTDSVSGKTFVVYNPHTGEKLCDVAECDKADVDVAVAAARKCFEETAKYQDGPTRRDLMLKLADLLEQNKETMAALETLDNGKPYTHSLYVDVALGIKCLRYYAGWADKLQGDINPVEGNFLSLSKKEPVGVCGQVIPWNFPLLMMIWKLGPALAAGCTVVLKPAEQTPLTALRMCELIVEAGYPAGNVNVLPGYGPTAGAAIAEHMDVDKVAFTGSSAVGKLIMQAAGRSNLKKCTLELGGKSPLIICKDADIDNAVKAAIVGVFFNQGQVCTASSRLFVHEDIKEEFTKKLIEASANHKTGDPFDLSMMMGPLVSERQHTTVTNYIKAGQEEGATLALGGKGKIEGLTGYYCDPTIFTDVKDDMKIAREEIFGPVMSIMTFKTLDEAITRANNTTYGLAAGIFTNDINTALKYANEVKAGTCWVNTYNAFDTAQPFGGFKQSGIGRELGSAAISLYQESKTIMIATDFKPVK